MRRFTFGAALVLCAGVAWAAFPYTYKYEMASCPSGTLPSQCTVAQACTANSCTGTAPSASTEGMTLAGVSGYKLTICAATGQTLSGAGTLQAWVYNSAEAAWARDTALDQTVSASATRCAAFPDFKMEFRMERVRFVASGVTVSLGDATHGLDVLLEAQSYAR